MKSLLLGAVLLCAAAGCGDNNDNSPQDLALAPDLSPWPDLRPQRDLTAGEELSCAGVLACLNSSSDPQSCLTNASASAQQGLFALVQCGVDACSGAPDGGDAACPNGIEDIQDPDCQTCAFAAATGGGCPDELSACENDT